MFTEISHQCGFHYGGLFTFASSEVKEGDPNNLSNLAFKTKQTEQKTENNI